MDSAAGNCIPAGGAAAASNPDANAAAAAPPQKKTWQRKMPKQKKTIGRYKGSGAKSKKQKHPWTTSVIVATARPSQAASREKQTRNSLPCWGMLRRLK